MATLQFDPIQLDGIDRKKHSEIKFLDHSFDRKSKLCIEQYRDR